MIITHFFLGFLTSYLGFTPPSMLNLTVGKISLEKDKKSAYQFILGASLVVFLQFFLSFLIVYSIEKTPNVLFWIQNTSIFIFAIVSFYFLKKGIVKNPKNIPKNYKNNFIHGLTLSFINMFAIPFFAISYSLLVMEGFITSTSISIIIFALGIFFGTVGVLVSYVCLIKKLEKKILFLTKYINPTIGIITGFFAIYSTIKLYL